MKKLMFIILMSVLVLNMAGCVLVSGRDKDRLDSQVVWADATYKIALKDFDEGKEVPQEVMLKWLNFNRLNWAYFAGASEGLSAEEVIKELDKND